MRITFAGVSGFLLLLSTKVHAQNVVIRNATPDSVVAVLKADLVPQGFKFVNADKNNALFTLDRGMVAQRTGGMVHVRLELHAHFKQQSDGLQVNLYEEVVGETGTAGSEFRRPVENQRERDNLQHLLDGEKARIEGAKHDST
jgi:hypothetical protein